LLLTGLHPSVGTFDFEDFLGRGMFTGGGLFPYILRNSLPASVEVSKAFQAFSLAAVSDIFSLKKVQRSFFCSRLVALARVSREQGSMKMGGFER
jgi:hypothetical protein